MTAHDAALVKVRPKERLRRHSAVALALFALLFTLLLAVIAGFGAAMAVVDRTARVLPDYERIDLAPYLAKESYTEEDYDVLYHQTGLSRTAVDALEEKEMLLEYQEAFFYEGVLDHYMAAPTTPHCVLYTEEGKSYYAPIAPLEDGDILVTSTCHTFGWRNGHAAIILDASSSRLLEAVAPGEKSSIGSVSWFTHAANFLVLRLKGVSEEERHAIAEWAGNAMRGIDYSLFAGFFTPKDQGDAPYATHCSHLVWQAYKHFGYDIDSDGGPLVSCNDIARSDLLEVVQVYGFDPDELW